MYRYTVFMSIVCFILIIFSTFIRIMVTMDTIEKENALAEQQEANGDFVESNSMDDPDPSSYEAENHPSAPHKLRASKYENT